MLTGIHRGFKSLAGKMPNRAWVAEAPGESGKWLSEAEYRAGAYAPDFDSLPWLTTTVTPPTPVDIDALPPEERDYLKAYLERKKNAEGS